MALDADSDAGSYAKRVGAPGLDAPRGQAGERARDPVRSGRGRRRSQQILKPAAGSQWATAGHEPGNDTVASTYEPSPLVRAARSRSAATSSSPGPDRRPLDQSATTSLRHNFAGWPVDRSKADHGRPTGTGPRDLRCAGRHTGERTRVHVVDGRWRSGRLDEGPRLLEETFSSCA
jgi:hypothetical protein